MFYIVRLLLLYNILNTYFGYQAKADDFFTCNNGKNIKKTFRCDKDNDCGDNSDENNCNYYGNYRMSCSKNDFECINKNCISNDKFCDGYSDCTDGSDEYNGCEKDLMCEDKFRCGNGYCLPKAWVCDGMKDCLDGSDEINCISVGCKIENYLYQCKNKQCISLDKVCNNVTDCQDKSDENFGCQETLISCSSISCDHDCIRTPYGPVCICQQGYKLENNTTCIDINECKTYGICDQQCVNTEGSYKCICQEGYTLQDDMKTCKNDDDETSIIFSTGSSIRGIYLESKIQFDVINNLDNVVNIATDGKYVYWSENNKTIVKGTKSGKKEIILTIGLQNLSDIAVDWITGNIYFTDEDNQHIGVCDNNGMYCTILINEGIRKPTEIALLPTNGIMYWCDSSGKPYIANAGMDGKNITLFITKRLKSPKSLTIDYPNNRLYWLDTHLAIIESIQLDGTNRRITKRETGWYSLSYSRSLAIFENKLYWSRWENDEYNNYIQYCNKFSGQNSEKFTEFSSIYKLDVQIHNPVIKSKVENACFPNPCSQLCLLNRHRNYTCACALDRKLDSDGHTCRETGKSQHIIMVADGTFLDYYHELLGKPNITTSVTLRHITAITYDSLSGTILASDGLTDYIFRYNPISREITNLIPMTIESLKGMAFDHIGNNLYLTNIEQNTIEVHSLTTMAEKIFYIEEQPYDIALVPEEGIMFVVLKANDKYYIDKMQMNGLGTRSVFVESNLLRGPKVSLCYDTDKKKIFWSDQGTKRIASASLTGFDYQFFQVNTGEPMDLAVTEKHIFWTVYMSNRLYWVDKDDILQKNENFAVYISESVKISYLVVPRRIDVQEIGKAKHGCRKNNGNCSHVCLPTSTTLYHCACPPDMVLKSDNYTCGVTL